MADENDELVCSVLLDKKYDFVVVVSKSRTIGELRAEIDNVVREVYPEFRGGQVSRVENLRGSILPDRYKAGTVLGNESRIICYSSDATGGKEKENARKRLQQVQMPETVRNKLSVANNKAKHSLLETKRKHTVCSSSEEMLFASKYKSLYSMPEHCRPKRKEAIEESASKVAEWLSSNEVSSDVDSQDTQSDEGTMEVESESEDRPRPVVGKRVPVVEKCVETVTSINRKGNSDDDEDDSDVEDGSCYSVGEDSDNRDDSMVNGLDNSQRATAKKATCYTPKSARDARVSVSTSKSKRRALSTTLRGTQSNLPPSATDRKNRSTGNCDFPSLAGNLPRCRIKIRKLPLCIKHGRNLKVVQHKTCHGNNKRSEHRDVTCNRGSNFDKREHRQEKESDSTVPQKEVYLSTVKNQRIQKTKNTRIKDHYADIEGDIESGAELLNDKRRNLVNSLSGTVKRHLGSKNRISKRFPKRAKVQRRSYVDTSAQESSREDHDDCDGLLTENRNNSDVLNRGLRQSSQSLIEDATTKNDNDTDGDKDDDDDESDDLTPLLKREARLTVAEVYSGEEGDVISFVAGETAMPELDIQRGAGCKEKGEISWKGKKIPTGGTNSIEESLTQNINKQIEKQVSSERDVEISPKQCRSPKKNLLSKKSLPLSKSKGAVESSKQKTDDTLGNETGDNSGERQLRSEINETSRLSTVPMKFKSHSERLVNIELSEGKYSGVDADDASGIVVEESRELVTESTGNTNDNASVDETCQEREANNVSQTDEEAEEKDKESTPMYLTPIKKGEQIAWLKDSSRTADSEQMGDEYEDFMKRLEISDCNTSSDETKRSKTENSPPLSSETDKESENNEEKGQESIESRTNGGRKSTKTKKRSQRKNTGLEGNEDTFVTNVGQVSVSDKPIVRNKTMGENLELEFNSPINKRSQQKHRKLEEDIDTMAENVNEETVGERRIISEETMEGNVELELTPQSPSEKKSTQKQRKVQMNKDRLMENVNEETVGDITTILEKTTKGDGRCKSTSQSPIKKKRSEQKPRKLQDGDRLVENVFQEIVGDGRIISKKSTERNLELDFTPQSPTEKRSKQKQRKLQKNEDPLVERDNEETVGDITMISEKTTEGNVELELTPQIPTEKRSEQKQGKLENEHSLVENVGEDSACDGRIISKEATEGSGELEVTPQSPTEKKSKQKQRKLEDEHSLVENVGEEGACDGRIISNETTEGNGELEVTPKSPTEKKSKQKRRKLEDEHSLVENVGEESACDERIISKETTEGNGELELTPQSPTEKKSKQKRRKLEDERSLVENVGEEGACDGRIISNKTTEGNGELEVTPKSPTEKKSKQKRRKLEDEHSLVENVGEESACDERIISKETTEGNEELELTPQSPTGKKSKQKRRKLEDERSLVENVGEEGACDGRIISNETTEGNGELEVTPQSPTQKKSKQKRRKLDDEHSLVENVCHESVRKTTITSKKRVSENVELECATEDYVNNKNNIKRALKRKTSKGDFQCHLLKESDSQALVGMETPKKKAREEGSCEDQRNDNNKKTHDGKTGEGANSISDGHKGGNQKEILKNNKKKKREKRKEKNELSGTESSPESTPTSSILEKVESSSQSKDKQNERMKREFGTSGVKKLQISNRKANEESNCDLLQTEQESQAFLGGEKPRKKDRYREEKHGEDDEKSHERKTSNQMENVNSMSDQVQKEIYEQKSKKKKKEKRRKSELNSMESAAKLPSPLTLKTVTSDSLDDSGYSENGHNKSKQHEQCRPEQVESVQQLRISKKRKASTNHEKETLSGQELPTSKPDNDFSQQKTNSKKKSKTSLSLLDLALDDTAEQGNSNKAGNRKTVQSEGRPAHQMRRHFRQMPKGFLHSAKIRRTASQSTIVVRRKPRTNPKANVEMTAKDKDLVISGMSFEQLLDDESFWTT